MKPAGRGVPKPVGAEWAIISGCP